MADVKEYICDKSQRLDKFLTSQITQTRSQIAQLIKQGCVEIDGCLEKRTGVKLKVGQKVAVEFPQMQPSGVDDDALLAQDWIEKIEILYEDDAVLVLNKPSGVTVHPAPSVKEPTLVDWLKYKNIRLSTISGEERHGIVHRLDKGTSGAIVVAKTNEAHQFLSKQLQDKSMGRYYLAIITPPLKDHLSVVASNIGRSATNRLKMASGLGYAKEAKTVFAHLALSDDEKLQLIACKLFTGRTHQIRVHLESLNRHIVGDHLYGVAPKGEKSERIMLHAYMLYFIHPVTQEQLFFQAGFDTTMEDFMRKKFERENLNEKIVAKHIVECFTAHT